VVLRTKCFVEVGFPFKAADHRAACWGIYGAESTSAAAARLEEFGAGPWGEKYPAITQSWRRNWEQVIPFFAFPAAVRRIIYTTNAIESLHSEVRKAVRGRGHFPSDEAATKLAGLHFETSPRTGRMHPSSGTQRKRNSRYSSKSAS